MKLGMQPKFNEAWCLQQAERNDHADPTPRTCMGPTVFEKTLAQACPACGAVFFTFQPRDTPYPPFADLGAIQGPRMTCGDPRCHKAEEDRWWRNNEDYRRTCVKYFDDLAIKGGAKAPDLKPKLVKLGER